MNRNGPMPDLDSGVKNRGRVKFDNNLRDKAKKV